MANPFLVLVTSQLDFNVVVDTTDTLVIPTQNTIDVLVVQPTTTIIETNLGTQGAPGITGPTGPTGPAGPAGGLANLVVTPVSSNYTLQPTDNVLAVDSSGGSLTINLGTPAVGRYFIIKDVSGSFFANNIFVNPGASTIDGVAGNLTLGGNRMSIGLILTLAGWAIV